MSYQDIVAPDEDRSRAGHVRLVNALVAHGLATVDEKGASTITPAGRAVLSERLR